LRIRCEAETAQCPLGKKFGCDPETEAPRLLKIASSLGLDVVGISFHVGSGCSDYPVYKRAIEYAKDLFDYGETLGYQMTLLDIGGGFPGDNDKAGEFENVAAIINEALETYFPDKGVRVIAEPGRFYVASAFTLATNIHSKKYIRNRETAGIDHIMYYINDGVYGSFNCLLYDHQKIKPIILNPSSAAGVKTYPSTIFGPTCDALDTLLENEKLPDIPIGEYLVFENMGAYTLCVASPFNGFPLPKVHCFISLEIWEMLKTLIPLNDDYFIKPSSWENLIANSVYG
jgi:ornithine decarboxylase